MKKLLVILVVAHLVLAVTGFSWGGVSGPRSMQTDNSVNYIPWPVYNLSTWRVTCWLLPFEKFYTDSKNMVIGGVWTKYNYVHSGRCYGIVNWVTR